MTTGQAAAVISQLQDISETLTWILYFGALAVGIALGKVINGFFKK